jgi:CO dehydrogenase maturation factor
MGTVDTGGSGCVCPEHVMLKAILTNLVFRRDDVVIMDMEAGLEHLGRGTASMMDQFIVVIEPGARSVQTYVRIKELAKDIGVTKVRVVANKIRDESDREFIRSRIPADDLLGFISYSPTVIDADRKGLSPYDCSPDALDEIRAIKAAIDAKE